MRFAASISTNPQLDAALAETVAPIDQSLTRGMVDLLMVFCTAHFEDDLEEIVDHLGETFGSAVLLGCTAEGTIGAGREVERRPSLSLLAGCLPDVRICPFSVEQAALEQAQTHHDWERVVGVAPESEPIFIALADPFQLDVSGFVEQLSDAYPNRPLLGGVASAGAAPGENRLVIDGDIREEGVVGVALTGNVTVQTVVSQGCRPIGRPFVITKGEHNIVHSLGGEPALARLQSVLVELSPADERLARQSLLMGRVINEYQSEFARGDFLIHNIIGADRQSGAIAIAGPARVGATVQFHVRDAESADDDLRTILGRQGREGVRGALLFSCNGRGTRMWPEPGHDVGVLHELVGGVPVAGCFCGGEFGPVGGRNFLHGFTASIALFAPAHADPLAELL